MDDSIKKDKRTFTDYQFLIICIIMFVLLLIRDVNGIYLSKWIFFVISMLVFLLFDINYTAIFICFFIPFTTGLPYKYIFIVGLLIFIAKHYNSLVFSKYLIPLIYIFIVELLSFIYGGFSIADFIRFASPLLFIALVIFNDRDNLNYEKMLRYFLLAAICTEISILLQSISNNGLDYIMSTGIRLGDTKQLLLEEGMRISYNPNSLGTLCAFSISILLILLNKASQGKVIIIVLLIIQILVGSLSLSRSFLILLAVIAFIYLLYVSRSLQGLKKGLIFITIVTVGVSVSVNFFAPNLLENYSSRFEVTDISNGRQDIIESYFDVLAQHPERLLLGVGLQDYSHKYGLSDECHNGLQEILVTWGVVGIFLVALYIYGIYKFGLRGVPKKERELIYILPLIVLIIDAQSGQFFYSGNSPFYFLPMYAAIRMAYSNYSNSLNRFVKDS